MVDRQYTAWRLYTVLRAQARDWSGKVVLYRGMDDAGMALAVAANLCGAVFLGLEPDPAQARVAMRGGFCDFLVNTLDEALRAMKNEVRKHRPLTVVLEGDADAMLAQMRERGVYPDLLVTSGAEAAVPAVRAEEIAAMLRVADSAHGLLAMVITASSVAELRAVDRAIAEIIPEGDPRRAWATGAPKFFLREQPPRRYVWLDDPEFEAMTAVLPEGATIAALSHSAY